MPVTVMLQDREITTGCGVRWPAERHDLPYHKRMALEAGFELRMEKALGKRFRLVVRKPETLAPQPDRR